MSRERALVCTTLAIALSLMGSFFAQPGTAGAQAASAGENPVADFATFAQSIRNGQAASLRGVYAPDVMAYPIVQQPAGDPAYVTPVANTVTQFALAGSHGTVGLLAHNYLAGSAFPKLAPGQEIRLVYGDGHFERYTVSGTRRFQALDPQNPQGDFIDLHSGQVLPASALFESLYASSGRLVLQTCIAVDGELSWGRLFVIAEPAG